MLDDDVRDAYLRRLGVEPAPPSADALRTLFQRHVERVPYETMWLFAGEAWTVDPIDAARRIALEKAGGDAWTLLHDPKGGFTGMRWTLHEAGMPAVTEKHGWLTTSPESPFLTVSSTASCRCESVVARSFPSRSPIGASGSRRSGISSTFRSRTRRSPTACGNESSLPTEAGRRRAGRRSAHSRHRYA